MLLEEEGAVWYWRRGSLYGTGGGGGAEEGGAVWYQRRGG